LQRCSHQGLDLLAVGGVHGVDDSDLVTAGGVTSGLDLGLYLLEGRRDRKPPSPWSSCSNTSAAAWFGAITSPPR
jgi:hypothetical protein